MRFITVFVLLLLIAAGSVYSWAQGTTHTIRLPEERVEMKPGDGLTKVEAFCNICHSLDYIIMQPKFTRMQWAATVNKMIKVFGAPINEEDAKLIAGYLVAQYGAGN
jgi:hypothetical protein